MSACAEGAHSRARGQRFGRLAGSILLWLLVMFLPGCQVGMGVPDSVQFGGKIKLSVFVTEPTATVTVVWSAKRNDQGRASRDFDESPSPNASSVTSLAESTLAPGIPLLGPSAFATTTALLRPGNWDVNVRITPSDGVVANITCPASIQNVSSGQPDVELQFFQTTNACSCPDERCDYAESHDVAVQGITFAPTPPVQGYEQQAVNVQLVNHGDYDESFTLELLVNDVAVGTAQTVSIGAHAAASPPPVFTWPTTSLGRGPFHLTARIASSIFGETGINPATNQPFPPHTDNNSLSVDSVLSEDADRDRVADEVDNCPTISNPRPSPGAAQPDACGLLVRAVGWCTPAVGTCNPPSCAIPSPSLPLTPYQGCAAVFGSGFVNVTKVEVGGTAVSQFFNCDPEILWFKHEAGLTGPITVTANGAASPASAALYCPTPAPSCPSPPTRCSDVTVEAVTPRAARVGDRVNVVGCGLDPAPGRTTVSLEGIPMQGITFPFASYGINRVLSFVVPNNATSGRVVVTVTDPANAAATCPAVTSPFVVAVVN